MSRVAELQGRRDQEAGDTAGDGDDGGTDDDEDEDEEDDDDDDERGGGSGGSGKGKGRVRVRVRCAREPSGTRSIAPVVKYLFAPLLLLLPLLPVVCFFGRAEMICLISRG